MELSSSLSYAYYINANERSQWKTNPEFDVDVVPSMQRADDAEHKQLKTTQTIDIIISSVSFSTSPNWTTSFSCSYLTS